VNLLLEPFGFSRHMADIFRAVREQVWLHNLALGEVLWNITYVIELPHQTQHCLCAGDGMGSFQQ
jgi:hypothetical protein